jgi:hypothetical protein
MGLNEDANELKGIFKELQGYVQQTMNGLSSGKDSLNEIVQIASEYQSYQQGINNLSSEQLDSLSKRFESQKKSLSLSKQQILKEADANVAIKSSLSSQIKSLESKKRLNTREQVQLGNLKSKHEELNDELKDQENTLIAIDSVIEDIDGEAEKLAKNLKRSKMTKGFEEGMSNIQVSFLKIPGPLALISKLITFAFDAAVKLDESLGNTAKSMNISYEEAEKQRIAIKGSVEEADQLFIRVQDVVNVSNKLNDTLGTNVVFQDMGKALQNDIKLISKFQKIAGLSAEEGEAILKYSLGTGQEATKLTKEIMGSYRLQGLRGKLVLNEKDAMKEIANTSARLQLSIKGGASGLGEALASSKALGVSLGQVENIANSLLDFETSITNELNAELLLGRDINLDKARQAALDNDMATVAEEIAKYAGTAAEFGNLNRIAQEGIASAVGMQANGLAESLLKQEELKSISEDASLSEQEKYERMLEEGATREELEARLGEQALASIEEQASAKEMEAAKTQELQEQIQNELLGNMNAFVNSLKEVFNIFDKIFKSVGGMKTVMIAIGGIITGKILMGLGSAVIKSAELVGLASAEAAARLTSNAAITFGIGAAIAVAAGLAAYALLDSEVQSTGDLAINPNGGPIVMSPNEGGIFQGTKNDQVAMGPDVINQAKGGGSNDMSQTNALLQQLINAVTSGGDVILDGNKVGQALNIGARKLQ